MKNKIIFKTLMLKGEAGSTIVSMEKTGHVGTADIYTITFNDGSTTEISLENMSAITSVEKTSSTDTEDIYTITCADGSTQTFSVLNHNADIAAMSDDIDVMDARLDNFLATQTGVSNGTLRTETTLFSSTVPSMGNDENNSGYFDLEDSVDNYDEIVIRYSAFSGKSAVVTIKPDDIPVAGGSDSPLHWSEIEPNNQITIDAQNGDRSVHRFMAFTAYKFIDVDRVSIDAFVWGWNGSANSNGVVSSSFTKAWNSTNGAWQTSGFIGGIYSITGIKYEEAGTSKDPELADLRVGADGTVYNSAGDAMRGQVTALEGQIGAAGNNLAAEYDATQTYVIGDYCVNDGVLYVCTTVISTAEAWTAGHWTAVKVMSEMTAAVGDLDDQISTLTEELNEAVDELKGDLSNSSTPIKFEVITGKYVKYIDGTLGTAESNGYTDYIDVSNYKQILFKQTTSTASNPTSGTAFYDENKVYVGGIQAIKSMAQYGYYGELVLADVPNNAKYARFTTWADTLTFGSFELYGVNEKYYESLSNNDFHNLFEKENNIVGLGGFYYQKWCNYGNSAARQIQVIKYGNKFMLNGTTTADTRIKITNNLAVATTNGGVDGFANPLKFVIGHTYSATLRFIGTYPGAEGNVTLSAYKPSTHSSAGSLYWNKNGCVRRFTATQTDYNICIYINDGVTVTDLECIVEITDETGDYRNIAETYRIYDNSEYGTVQSGAIIGKKIYAYESNNSGSVIVVDTLTGESTSTSLSMGHGNDMTVYNGKLYVTSMEETGRIFIVDPDTLDIESYVDFTINGEPAVSFGIAYDKVNNQFVLEVEDDFVFADTSLVYKSSVAREYLSGSTRQGFECDGYYLYCPEYNKNNIVVYDYTGKFVKEISIPNRHEPEGLFNDWTGGWWLFTNIPSHEWYVDAINFRNKLSFSMMCAVARVI